MNTGTTITEWSSYPKLVGLHSFLSPSNYHWINYDAETLDERFRNYSAIQRGTELHAFAAMAINLRQKLSKSGATLNAYVNDAIGFRMDCEVTLFYSPNCFGTTDAISFKNNLLRIHDLKTGSTRTSMSQLKAYAAIFCLEYNKDPNNINIELRIYQSDEIMIEKPDPTEILYIMQKIKDFSARIDILKMEAV
jgi:hypothetical protein